MKYFKDGKEVRIDCIGHRGVQGQLVVLDHVSYGENPDLEECPLAVYPQPSFFTIVEVRKLSDKDHDVFYALQDSRGRVISLTPVSMPCTDPYLYDLATWAMFHHDREVEMERRKDGRIKLLESHLDLLKAILVAQGVRVITEAQAAQLGIQKK